MWYKIYEGELHMPFLSSLVSIWQTSLFGLTHVDVVSQTTTYDLEPSDYPVTAIAAANGSDKPYKVYWAILWTAIVVMDTETKLTQQYVDNRILRSD
jgi:hypothetical protein